VSKFDYSSLILLDLEVKINEICYRSLLPPQQLLPVVRQGRVKLLSAAGSAAVLFNGIKES